MIPSLLLAASFMLEWKVPVAHAQDEPASGSRSTLRISPLQDGFKFGRGFHPSSLPGAVDSIANLVVIDPELGAVPAGATVVKVFANKDHLVLSARCMDPDPSGIVSFSKAKDSALDSEDHILFVLDTFQDERSGYVFAVNPSGSRFDGLVIERGEDVNSDWDAIWEAHTGRDESGWYATLVIPIKSLDFDPQQQNWGFNVQRRVQRLQETSRWSGLSRDFEIFQTSRAGQLADLPRFDLGLGLTIRPALVGTTGHAEAGEKSETDGEVSLDVTQRLGPTSLASLTVNTDFAETEVDVRQINLTRFPSFFPEKRTFFLAGADIFEFGVGLDEESMLPFFSRRIGLFGASEDDQSAIPIDVGGKVTGRSGETNFGALAVGARKLDDVPLDDEGRSVDVPASTMGAFRIKQNVFEESSIGLLGTFGDPLDRSSSWSAGADYTYQTSNFMDEKNLLMGVWGMLNDREGLEGDKSAFGARIDYPNDLLDMNLTSIRIGDGFDPSLGFVPRNDVHIWDFAAEFVPRPPSSLIRQMFHELSITVFSDRGNDRWESYTSTIKPLDWLLESGDRYELGVNYEGDRPPAAFEIATDFDLGKSSYEWTRYFAGATFAPKRMISGTVRWEFGNYYNGTLTTVVGSAAFKPSSFLTVELTGETNHGELLALDEDGVVGTERSEFTEELVGARLLLNFSPDLQFSSLTQYDTQGRDMSSNNRLRWTFHPQGDLFVVYNHNQTRAFENRWKFVSNQTPVKIQYAWRF